MGIRFRKGSLVALSLLIGSGSCSVSLLGALSLPAAGPTSIDEAISFFNNGTETGDFLKAQGALHWIKSNLVEVLRSPSLNKLSYECLLQVLSQPAYIDEIEVFRAVKRLVEDPNSAFRYRPAALFSMVRLVSIDVEKLKNEVVPSGIWPERSIIDALLQVLSGKIPKEYTRRTLGDVPIVPVLSGNVVRPELGARIITDNRLYTISPGCGSTNPLIPLNRKTTTVEEKCFIESEPAEPITVYLGGEFLIREITMYTAVDHRCSNLRLEVSLDNEAFTTVATVATAYSSDTRGFEPRPAAYVRYRSEKCQKANGGDASSLRVTGLTVRLTNVEI